MGNPWKAASGRKSDWFPVSRKLISQGHVRDLGESALRLYLFINYLSQKHSAVHLEISNSEIEVYAGLTQTTAKRARQELCAAGLLKVTCPLARTITYTLVEPGERDIVTGELIPLRPADFRTDGGLRKYKAISGQTARAVRQGRKLLPGYRLRTIHKKDVPKASVGGYRRDRYIVPKASVRPSLQVVESSLLHSDKKPALKNSEKRGISEGRGRKNECVSQDEVGMQRNLEFREEENKQERDGQKRGAHAQEETPAKHPATCFCRICRGEATG